MNTRIAYQATLAPICAGCGSAAVIDYGGILVCAVCGKGRDQAAARKMPRRSPRSAYRRRRRVGPIFRRS